MYKTLLYMEVQNSNSAMPQRAGMQNNDQTTEIDIQTQVNLLHSDSFLRRGAERMQSETVPLPPTGGDISRACASASIP